MKKILLFFATLIVLLFSGCDKQDKNEPNIDQRLKFVGVYTLDITSDVSITNGSKTVPFDMGVTNKNLKIELDESDKSKLKVTGYYGSVSATVSNGYLYIDKYSGSTYTSGIYFVLIATHNKAQLSNNKLTWTSCVEIAGIGASTLYGSGTLYNTATK